MLWKIKAYAIKSQAQEESNRLKEETERDAESKKERGYTWS